MVVAVSASEVDSVEVDSAEVDSALLELVPGSAWDEEDELEVLLDVGLSTCVPEVSGYLESGQKGARTLSAGALTRA